MSERLQKFLASAGLGSRRQIEDWIRQRRIVVNGQPAQLGLSVSNADRIEIDGKLATKTGMEAEIQAKHTARNLARVAKGDALKPYSISLD